jgi:YHS domain-containing protein
MKMKNLLLCALLSVPFAGCDKKPAAAPSTTATATAAAGAVGDDATVPKLAAGTAAKCPVTGEDFTVKESTVQVTYNGKRYAFCCADCQPTFAKSPAKYAKN